MPRLIKEGLHRFWYAMAAYAVLCGIGAIVLTGKLRIAIFILFAGLVARTLIARAADR